LFVGFIIYFYYGIKNSLLELADSAPEETIIAASDSAPQVQLTKDKPEDSAEKSAAKSGPVFSSTKQQATEADTSSGSGSSTVTRPSRLDPPKATTRNDMFVSPSAFPSWDD
jgi:hypothetical protein